MALDMTPESPGWWLQRLLTKLRADRTRFDNLDKYYRCENGIPVHAEDSVKEAFKRLMTVSRSNWAALSVQAPLERMRPTGFRTGAAGDQLGDDAAWEIWQANGLDAGMPRVFEASLSMSLGLMIVGSVDPEIEAPLITPEDPREVVVETDPRRRSRVLAGLKVFRDEVGNRDRAYLYLPGKVSRFSASTTTPSPVHLPSKPIPRHTHPDDANEWELDSEDTVPGNIVPVVPFPANPTLHGVGVGEFEPHLPLLDRINFLVLQELQIATLQAFRQMAVKGDLPDNDDQGNPIDYDDIFAKDPGALWKLPDGVDLWESGQVDLGGIRNLVRDQVQDFAALSGTPLFYLTPEATDGSAEGAALARERLIFKTKRHITDATEPLEQVMSYAFLMAGDEERASRKAMEVIWAAPERFSMNEMADAGTKALKGGLTLRQTRERVWGATPQEIEQMEEEDAAEALRVQGVNLVGQVMNGTGPDIDPAAG